MSRDRVRSARISACGLAAAAGLLGWGVSQAQGPDANATRGALICGPRSVEYILFWYGKKEDVSDLIWELQGGDVSQPVSLAAVAETLAKRQVYTKAVEVSPGAELKWPYPVILHMTQTSGPGHFVVQVPPADGRPTLYWSGPTGYSEELCEGVCQQRRSGVVLLTSPTPIGNTVPVAEGGWGVAAWVAGAAVALAGFVGMVAQLGRRRSAARAT